MIDDQLVVRDLGSSNGTQINDQIVSGKTKLNAGDRLQLGPVVFTVTVDGYPEVVDASMTLIHHAQQVESQTVDGVTKTASAKSDSRHVLSSTSASSADKQANDTSNDIYDLSSDPANSGANRSQSSKAGSSSAAGSAQEDESAIEDLDALLLAPTKTDDDEFLKMFDADDDPLANLEAKTKDDSQSPPGNSPTAIDGASADTSAETSEVQATDDDNDDDDLSIDDPLAELEAMTDGLLDDDDDDLFDLDDSDIK